MSMTLPQALSVAETVTPTPIVAHQAMKVLVAELSRYGDPTAGPLPRIAGLLAEAERTMLDPECAALNGHLRELSYAISGFKQRFPEHWPKK